jgi:hypothetical protein
MTIAITDKDQLKDYIAIQREYVKLIAPEFSLHMCSLLDKLEKRVEGCNVD